jgi:hypothetical protein
MRLRMTQQESFHVDFYEHIEGKISGFSMFRESEKTLKKTPGSSFFVAILIGSKKG